jgi:hypothetical protein
MLVRVPPATQKVILAWMVPVTSNVPCLLVAEGAGVAYPKKGCVSPNFVGLAGGLISLMVFWYAKVLATLSHRSGRAMDCSMAVALAEVEGATPAFDALAPSKRKDFVRQVNEAKTKETRDRRIAAIVAKLSEA